MKKEKAQMFRIKCLWCGKLFDGIMASCGTGTTWSLYRCPHCKKLTAEGSIIPNVVKTDPMIKIMNGSKNVALGKTALSGSPERDACHSFLGEEVIGFTKEEISLCKRIAEKHRKEIKYGDWYWSKSYNKPLLATDGGFNSNEQEHHGVFKIWTISDCLEFLGKKFHGIERWPTSTYGVLWLCRLKPKVFKSITTPLEACLKAVLAVLEEVPSG